MADTSKPTGPMVLENTTKRDFLQDLEKKYQQQWREAKYFEVDPPTAEETEGLTPAEIQEKFPKWMGTFPYPYMNGILHLGHAFTVSKVEFATGYQRMIGKRALFPMGFHVTGMPIKSAADKLIREMEKFGENFERFDAEAEEAAEAAKAPVVVAKSLDKSKATKGKLAGKSTGLKYQFQIMAAGGIPIEEIKKFADPVHWLSVYPPIAQDDCNAMGARIDWRRSFLTTDQNPFYDSFIRWQMNLLHDQQKIKFGRRNTIYSALDQQPCMDHDRSVGEAVGPQDYTAIKMSVVSWSSEAQAYVDSIPELKGKKVIFIAASLRSETMYGQTNCYVGTAIKYGLFAAKNNEVYLCTRRSANNMAFQDNFEVEGKVDQLGEIVGSALIGTKVNAPLSVCGDVYVIPMEGVLATKGTGVVTCAPSDSPDDYATLLDLRKKPEFYKVDPSWLTNEPVPMIVTPKYGNLIAVELYKQFKINSQKDVKQLAEAKDIAYKEGFFNGVMDIGEFKGMRVEDAKPKVKDMVIAKGYAFNYSEPENLVMSRSGEECVVALVDQWYIDYGEEQWRKTALDLLHKMETYFPAVENGFEAALAWLKQWACSRSYGLGSPIPWDPQFLVESLSDSTIYMSYYTVANFLQNGDVYGKSGNPLGITPEDMTDAMWSYVLTDGPFPTNSKISLETAKKLKSSFEYFYPMNLRTSAKDLIPNHLSFCIYVHSAIFPEKHWPTSMRANGHLMLNNQKMSKSTGNSLTMRDAVNKFGADATRLTLADAGDGIEDANFEELTANAAIQRLYTTVQWVQETLADSTKFRTGGRETYTFWDRAFEAEMNNLTAQTKVAYEGMWYKEALQHGFYELEAARKSYIEFTMDIGLHHDLIMDCIRRTALLVQPIIPHFSEHIWTNFLKETKSVQLAQFPELSQPLSLELIAELEYIRVVLKSTRDKILDLPKRLAKFKGKGEKPSDPSEPLGVNFFVATEFPAWQKTCMDAVKQHWVPKSDDMDPEAKKVAEKEEAEKIKNVLSEAGILSNKKVMPFVNDLKKSCALFGAEKALTQELIFNETAALHEMLPYALKTLPGVESMKVIALSEGLATLEKQPESPGYSAVELGISVPGLPGVVVYNI